MRKRRYAALTAGILMITGVLSACGDAAAVKVIAVSELNSGYYGGTVNLNGYVTDEASQNIYWKENRPLEEIYVQTGDRVTKGQALAAYDTASLRLQLETEELKNQSLQLQITKCRQDLAQLEQGKIPVQTIIKKETTMVKGGRQKTAYAVLDDLSQPFDGKGTKKEPYRFLVEKTCAVMGTFFNKMAKEPYWFRLEVREENQPDGELLEAWNGDGGLLKQWHPESKIILENLDAVTELKDALKPEKIPEDPSDPEETKPAESRPEETKPEETYPEETKPEETHPEEEKPDGTEPSESSPEETEPEESKPDETKPHETEPSESSPGETIPEENTPSETQPEETMPGEEPEETIPDGGEDWFLDEDDEWSDVWGDGSISWGDGGIDWGMDSGADAWIEEPTEDPAMMAEEIQKKKEEANKELRSLELQLRQSDLNKQSLERDLEQSTINSAVDGVVKIVKDPRSESVSATDPMIQVISEEGWYILGECQETMLQYLKEGDIVSGFSYESGISFEAEIREISHFPVTGTNHYDNVNTSYYPFIAYLESADGLKKDEYTELSIPSGEAGADGIYLNQAFIRRENGRNYVMKRGADGALTRQDVTLGRIIYSDSYEIVSGLKPEDYIAFPYGNQVKEGAKTEEQSANDFWEEAYG